MNRILLLFIILILSAAVLYGVLKEKYKFNLNFQVNVIEKVDDHRNSSKELESFLERRKKVKGASTTLNKSFLDNR